MTARLAWFLSKAAVMLIGCATPQSRMTDLVVAMGEKNPQKAEELAAAIDNPNGTTFGGSSVLAMALVSNCPGAARVLIQKGADVNAQGALGLPH